MTTNAPFPPRQWLLAGGLFAVLVLALIAGYFLWVRQDYAVLYQDLREDDAAAITRTLETERIQYRLANGGADILVPASDIDQIRLDVAASDVAINGQEGFELFDQSDMGLNDFGQRIRYQRALQGELARTIRRMDGVVDARVHLYIPERSLFRAERRSAEAAVTLVTRRSQDMTPARVDGIRRLVAAAVADLNPTDVVVLDGRGQPLSGSTQEEASVSLVSAPTDTIDPLAELADLARAAARRAIPYRSFELALDAPRALLDGAMSSEDVATAPPLLILTSESSLSQEERDRVAAELTRAGLGEDVATLEFHVGPLEPRPAAPPPPASIEPNEIAISPPPSQLPWLWMALAGFAALAAVALIWRIARPRLSQEERRSFAEALRGTLDEDAEVRNDGVQ